MSKPRPAPAHLAVGRRGWNSGKRPTADFLGAVPHANREMAVEKGVRRDPGAGGAVVSVPLRRPRWLVPPLSWVIPFSSHRRVELDAVGLAVLQMCDGHRTVEEMIEKFARDNKLTFREAQLPVTQFLRQLTQRGIVAIVGGREGAKRAL